MPSLLELVHDGKLRIRIAGVEEVTLTPIAPEPSDVPSEPYLVRILTIHTYDATYEIVLSASEEQPLQVREVLPEI
jgi:hypothetical protein